MQVAVSYVGQAHIDQLALVAEYLQDSLALVVGRASPVAKRIDVCCICGCLLREPAGLHWQAESQLQVLKHRAVGTQ